MRRLLLFVTALAATACSDAGTEGPPVKILCPNKAGGLSSHTCMTMAQALEKSLGRQVQMMHKEPLLIGMREGKKAKPDGNTLIYFTVEMAIYPHLKREEYQGFPGAEDFELLCLLNAGPAAVTVRTDSPWKTLSDFIADAEKRPGEISLGTTKELSIWHLAAEYFVHETGVSLRFLPHENGAADAVGKLRTNSGLEAVICSPTEVKDGVVAGDLRILAVMDGERSSLFADVPTVREAIGKDLRLSAWGGLCVPKGTPKKTRADLVDALRRAHESEGFQKGVATRDIVPKWLEGEALTAFFAAESAKFKTLIDTLGVQ